MEKPLVSVIIPSYNHEKYIGRAIQSVLDQTFQDFELIISDDCSTDDSVSVINSFSDPRIHTFYQGKNLGAVYAIYFLNAQTTGKYIALLNSDDYWAPEKLEKQVRYMEVHPETGACFTQGVMVDEDDNEITELEISYANIFMQRNRTQVEWLRYFWEYGNALAHMSVLVRREIYATEFFLNPSLRQLPDFDLWTRLICKYPIHVVQESLVYHRRMFGEIQNTSSETSENSRRAITENVFISYKMLTEMPDELFIEGFSDVFVDKEAKTDMELRCERFFLLQNHRFAEEIRPYAQAYFMKNSLNSAFVHCMDEKYSYSLNRFFNYSACPIPKKIVKEVILQSGQSIDADELSAGYEACRNELEAIRNSRFWRMTKPFQAIIDRIRGTRINR